MTASASTEGSSAAAPGITLVTGATGHLGANLVRALLERGEAVRTLVRRSSQARALEGLEVERYEGDLRDEASLARAVSGCRRIYHLAAMISIRSGDRDALWDVNVLGTRRLLHAAQEAGVERVVHTSSFGAIGQNPDGPSDEEWLLDPFEPVMDYERSKAQSELEVLRAALRGLDVTIVNPSATVGPWDFRPSLVGRTIVDVSRGKMKAYVPGAFDWVPMRDVVAGHLAAMERGKRGERYLLSGEVASIDQVLDWVSEFAGAPRPRLSISPRVMQPVARAQDWVQRRFFPESTPRFNEHSIRLLTSGKRGSNQRARRELGLKPTPLPEAFEDAVRWFREYGYLN